jgi:hypothetical protein
MRNEPFYSSGEILNAFKRAFDGLPLEQALPTERHIFFLPRYFTISSVSNGNIIFTI